MQDESNIDLETYLERAPDPSKNRLRYGWHLERYRFAINSVENLEKIADVGCGWGFGTDFLGQFGKQAYGFEINPQLVDYASGRFPRPNIQFCLHNILDGPLPEAPFNLICMFEVIEHLEEPAIGLANLKNSLAENGVLILSTPNIGDNQKSDHPYHANKFTHKTLEDILCSHFEAVNMFSQGVPNPIHTRESEAENNRLLNLLRAVDVLQFHRFFSKRLKKAVTGQIQPSSRHASMRRDLVAIVPGCQVEANWSIAVCAI